tara:strand:- start:167 stop:301 length:135 start_codon:yes stop_codon:yes gene_type:complete
MDISTFDIQVHVEDTADTNDWLEYQEYLDMMEARDKQAQLEPQG